MSLGLQIGVGIGTLVFGLVGGFITGLLATNKIVFKPFKEEITKITNEHEHEIKEFDDEMKEFRRELSEQSTAIKVMATNFEWIKKFLEKNGV